MTVYVIICLRMTGVIFLRIISLQTHCGVVFVMF